MNIQEPQIIFEDDSFMLLNKPAGMIVNKADTTKNFKTVQEWVEEEFRIKNSELRINEESDFFKRSGIVHRLDKETSGLLIVAKNPESFINLQTQFKENRVNKTYTALVHGKIAIEEGEINAPIGRLPWNRTHFGILAAGRESQTFYKVMHYFTQPEELTLVEAYPKTGRTHQIRVHFQYLHHPLFADELYAGRKVGREDRKKLGRHFLHASKISFYHPVTNELLSFASELPAELVDFLSTLQ